MLLNLLIATLLLTCQAYATNLGGDSGGTLVSLNSVEVNSNIGIDTSNPGEPLDVQGTIRATMITSFSTGSLTGNTNYMGANLGIGSVNPGQAMDVQGTVRMTGFTLTGNGAAAGFILQANGSTGIGTWVPEPSGGGGSSTNWANTNTNDVYLPNNGNVGIGTNLTTTAALTVMNGNVGIGTWVPNNVLSIPAGNVQIGTTSGSIGAITLYSDSGGTTTKTNITRDTYTQEFGVYAGGTYKSLVPDTSYVASTNAAQLSLNIDSTGNPITFDTDNWTERMRIAGGSGNVGINSTNPGQQLDVQGTLRTTGFALAGNGATAGFILQANGSSGIGTWVPEPSGGGSSTNWVNTNTNDVYLPNNGNVGIGTNKTTIAALTVMNGNVGIGTWVPSTTFQTNGTAYINYAGGDSPLPGAAAFFLNTGNSILSNGTAMRIVLPSSGIQKALQFANNGDVNAWGSFEFNIGGTGLPGFALGPGGSSSRDTELYRNAASVLRTNSAFIADGNVAIATTSTTQTLNVVGNVGIGTLANSPYVDNTLASPGALVVGGNVGIGTWKPIDNLDIGQGTMRIGEQGSSNTGKYYYLNSQNTGSPFADDRLYINSSGTTNGTRVWVDGSGSTTGLSVANAGNEKIFVGAQSGQGYFEVYGTTNFYDSSGTAASNEILTMTQAHNIGIGTTTPSGGLVVMTGNVGIGTWKPGAILSIPSLKAASGTRYLCIDTNGNVTSSATACSGT